MLSKLFISKVRLKMLRKYLYKPEESYHVRALVRELDEEINAVRRELQNLEKVGILTSKRSGNRLIYSLVPTSPYIKELRNLLRKEDSEVAMIHKELSKISGISVAELTENFFTKEYPESTDVDLIIVADTSVEELNNFIKTTKELLGRDLRVAAIKTDELPFYFKKRDKVLFSNLAKDRITLIGESKNLYRYE